MQSLRKSIYRGENRGRALGTHHLEVGQKSRSFPGSAAVKSPPANTGDAGSVQCSCLGNPMDRGAWWVQSMGSQRVRRDWETKQEPPLRGPGVSNRPGALSALTTQTLGSKYHSGLKRIWTPDRDG